MIKSQYAFAASISSGISFDIFILAVIIAVLGAGFAYVGYHAQLIMLALPMAIVTVLCLILILHTSLSILWRKLPRRKDDLQ